MKLLLMILLLGVAVFAASGGGAGSNAADPGTTVEELKQNLTIVEREVALINASLHKLKDANRTLGSKIEELQQRINYLYSQLSELNSHLEVVRGQLGRNWTEVQILRGDVGKNATLLKGVQSGLELLWWLVVGLGAVAAAAVVLAVLAWRRAGRASAGGVEVCG